MGLIMTEVLDLSGFSPEGVFIKGVEVKEITITTLEGEIQILPGHASMISALDTGIFSYITTSGKNEIGLTSSGFLEVSGNKVSILAELIERRQDIKYEQAKETQKLVEEELSRGCVDQQSFKELELKLKRAIIRQQIAETKKD